LFDHWLHWTKYRALPEPFSAAEHDGRPLQHEPMPAGGHDNG